MLFIFKFLQHPLRRALVLGLAVFTVVAVLASLDLGRYLENSVLDICCRLKPVDPPPQNIIIVGIDTASLRTLGHAWPWPRRFHARLIRRLTKAGAALIVFDVFFGEPSNPKDDQMLAHAIRESGKVVLARLVEVVDDPYFSRQIGLDPLQDFCAQARGLGVSLLSPDPDGVLRRFHLSPAGQLTIPEVVVRHFKPNLTFSPGFSGLIRYAGPPQHLARLSYHQILDEKKPLPRERLQGRIVLIGRVLEDVPPPHAQVDAFATPFTGATRTFMSGVEIQGHIIHTLLTGTWGRELPYGLRLSLYLVIFLLFSLLVVSLSPRAGLVALSAACLAWFFTVLGVLCWFHVWIQPVLLGTGLVLIFSLNLLAHHMQGLQEKSWLRRAFTHYVSTEVVETLMAHPERLELGGEELVVTVMFAELVGFSELSLRMAPRDLINLLSDYFTPLTDIVLAHGGTLDKYMESSFMSMWGAPLPQEDHARRACQAALAMQRHMEMANRENQERGQASLGLRLGLHSGPVVAGNVGSRERFNYTIMGDTVNLASRLQGVNLHYGTCIILSDATRSLAAPDFLMRELDQVRVRGRMKPVTIFELLGSAPEDPRPRWYAAFEAGRVAYLAQDWRQAVACFEEVIRFKPEDGPANLYLRRCWRYLKTPPPSDWEGVFNLKN